MSAIRCLLTVVFNLVSHKYKMRSYLLYICNASGITQKSIASEEDLNFILVGHLLRWVLLGVVQSSVVAMISD